MKHSITTWPRQLETRITRKSGQRVLVKLGGQFSQMRFYVMEADEMQYRPVAYRQGLDKVTITELAEIQHEFKKNEALLKGGRA
jgi:hypothetical protein